MARRLCPADQFEEPKLSLDQRQPAQVFTVMVVFSAMLQLSIVVARNIAKALRDITGTLNHQRNDFVT
jgi:hypothetical protein